MFFRDESLRRDVDILANLRFSASTAWASISGPSRRNRMPAPQVPSLTVSENFGILSTATALTERAELSPRLDRLHYLEGLCFRCIPIVWANIIHEDDTDLVGRVRDITLRSVPLLRSLANDVAADVMFYQSPIYETKIRKGVISSINDAVNEYMATVDHCGRARPRVSILGHSLGSVIAYDIVKIQDGDDVLQLPPEFRLTSNMDVHVLFLCGSPLPLFLTCRGVGRSDIVPLANCGRVYNVFNPTDPVAYRIEPLIDPDCKAVNAHHVPFYSGGGGVQKHVQVKSAVQSFAESAYESGVTNALIKPVKNLLGFDAEEKKKYSEVVAKIKKLNRSERIDWVLQDSFIESAGEYVAAVASHCKYFGNPDYASFVRDKISSDALGSADESESIEPAESADAITS